MISNIISKLYNIIQSSIEDDPENIRAQEKSESNSRLKELTSQGFQIVYNYLDAFKHESNEKEKQSRDDLIWWCSKHHYDEENMIWTYLKNNPNKYSWIDKDFIRIVIRDFRRNK